jgi:cobalt transporter subunit CbtB
MEMHLTENKLVTAGSMENQRLVSGAVVDSKWPALVAAMLGALMIFGVGFSNLDVAHNAAHDTRHTMVFPCH